MKILRRLFVVFSELAVNAHAQQTGIFGVVSDAQDAVIIGAKVEVRQVAYSAPLSITGNPVECFARSFQFIGRFSF